MATKGSKLQVEKVHSNKPGSFSETLEYQLLHCNNFDGNNNKFYIIEIQKNSSGEYQLFSNYGRLGKTSILEIRQHFKGSTDPITNFDDIKDEYDAIIKKKERGKTTKGVKEFYTKVDVLSPTVGSSNICEAVDVTVSGNESISITADSHPEVTRIIEQLKEDNIHNILSKTSLIVTSRGLETDIGIVTESHIDNASSALDELRDHIINKDDEGITTSNNKYFSLIPKKFAGRLQKSDMIVDADKLAETYDLLDSLKNALKTMVKPSDDKQSSIDIDIIILEDQPEWDRLVDLFESRKHNSHSHLNNWKVKQIYKFNETNGRQNEYDSKLTDLGNEHELFHGSRNTNILSILINGFMIPPATAGHCTGRMFGNGVYSASCSSKALNYSTGFWDGSRDNSNAFIFITKFVMGNEQKCKNFKYSGADTGYDSVHGLNKDNGGSLLNDEYIVYNTGQTLITHLIELHK